MRRTLLRGLLVACLLVAGVVPVRAQVAFIAGNGATSQLVASLDTGNFTIGAESNKAVAACVSWNTPVAATITDVRWNPSGANEQLTNITGGPVNVGNRRVQCFCHANPTAATSFVRVTWSDSTIGSQGVYAAAFSGADQGTPCSDFTTGTATSAGPITVTVPNATANDMLMDVTITGANIDSIGANQTSIGSIGAPGDNHSSSYQDGADGGVMSWSLFFSDVWLTGGIRIAAASGGGGGGQTPNSLGMMGIIR